jgi:hypothetical protein
LFVFSLAQPKPKAATASKVSRAKVLRIELSPVNPVGQVLGAESAASLSAGTLVASTRSIV